MSCQRERERERVRMVRYSSAVFPALLAVSSSSATLLYHEFSSRPSSCLRLEASCLAVVLSPERRALRCSAVIARDSSDIQ